MTTWVDTDPALHPPFNTWPLWAVRLDIDIADIAGDVVVLDLEDTPEGKAELTAYDKARNIIRSMVEKGPT